MALDNVGGPCLSVEGPKRKTSFPEKEFCLKTGTREGLTEFPACSPALQIQTLGATTTSNRMSSLLACPTDFGLPNPTIM